MITVSEQDLKEEKETESKTNIDEELELKKFISKFDELDKNKNGQLGMDELSALSEECGNSFSSSEKHAVMLLLDKDCNGYVTRQECYGDHCDFNFNDIIIDIALANERMFNLF